MKNINLNNKKTILSLILVLAMVLSISVPAMAEENPVPGPKVVADPDSPTGYTGQFVYYAPDAEKVYFCGDLMLSNHADPTDTNIYTPFEYKPGLMRRGGSQFKEEMMDIGNGYWYYEVPLAAGANQYWFNVDDGTRMLPDPANHPIWSPNSNESTKNAYNALYVPYDEKQGYSVLEERVVENPRDGENGTWSYVPIEIAGTTHYLGVYLPYGYDEDREEPYKTIYMQHGGGQDESDWMGIGSVQNIMDNLIVDGLTEPAVLVTTGAQYLGNAQEGYPNLFNIILPFIEENYNVSDKAADRAFAGLSMGSMITQNIINYDASKFGYFGPWSGGMRVSPDAENLGETHIFFGSGLYEGGVDTTALEGTDAKYKVTRVAGAHDFNTWCQLFTIFARDYLWNPEAFMDDEELVEGPTVMKDPDSPTGYTVRFVYKNEEATNVTFVGDILLRNWVDPTDETVYTPYEYQPGLMRGGGAFEAEMEKRDGGYWVIEVPLAAGANQYWFYVDGNRDHWVTDPANPPRYAPDGLTGNARRAFNAVYVPYDPEKQDAIAGARVIENPRADGKTGTWDYVEIPTQIGGRTRYLGVYLPYGYDEDREEPYKTIYMQHGAQQDASDWMNIGSVPNIMDNLLAEGLTEPAIVVTTDSTYLGNAQEGYPNLFSIILPFVEENYNVSTNAADRAFAGLSMGGGITTSIINYDATSFGYFGIFSGGAGISADAENLGETNILIGIGPWDNLTFLIPTPEQLAALENTDANFKYLEVAGAHDFNTWCQLFTIFARDYLWNPEAFMDDEELVEGPTVMKDPDSPTGYTVRFVYKNEEATNVTFVADILLRNWADPSDETVYSPFEYQHGFMRGGGAYEAEMEKHDGGYWVIEVPLAAGANQYWFYVDGNRDYWVPDPVNSPRFAPDGLTGNARRAFNAVYVPYDPTKQDEIAGAREIENPRTDETKGTWDYVEIPTQIGDRTRYLGVYLPYGYDADREEPYKTIYMQHGGAQDASDWMNIGSVPNIMDNLLAEGLTEPAIVVTTDSTYLGNAQEGYPNLFNIILPFIEESYNVSTSAADRAFAGLSMGGMITSNIINYDATSFGYFGPWSGGMGINLEAENLGSTHILIAGGRYDFGLPNPDQVARLDDTDANYKNIVVAGGHDFNAWCQLFTIFARDYLWNPEAFEDPDEDSVLELTTDAHNIEAGDYFNVNASFKEAQSSNVVVLNYTFAGDKFEYANYTPVDGVTVVDRDFGDGYARITLMIPDYNAENLGAIMLRAKEDAELKRESQIVRVAADYVLRDESGNKTIDKAEASTSFTTIGDGTGGPAIPGDTNDDRVIDLIDLSNIIDWFGFTSDHSDWESLYIFFDFNNNGEIDISDISYVARLIK